MPRAAPDFQHHDANCIAGQRIGGGPQRGIDIGCAHRHEATRIEAEFGQPAHGQRAGFNFGKILPHPHQRPPRGHPPRKPCDESGGRSALPAGFREHLVHRGSGETALQYRVRVRMTERHAARGARPAMRFDALDAPAQIRKRVRACGA